jgi:hypothetical protein
MRQLLTWIRSLGNAGAIENARVLFDQHRADDSTVRALDVRMTAGHRAAA